MRQESTSLVRSCSECRFSYAKISVYPVELLNYNRPMTKYICIVVAAGMLAACEKKTETVTPAATPFVRNDDNYDNDEVEPDKFFADSVVLRIQELSPAKIGMKIAPCIPALLLFSATAFARIGETEAQIAKRYSEPTSGSRATKAYLRQRLVRHRHLRQWGQRD